MHEGLVLNRRIGPHHLVERFTVSVGVTKLEQVCFILDMPGRVVRELVKLARQVLLPALL
jgi:hypothetical protein